MASVRRATASWPPPSRIRRSRSGWPGSAPSPRRRKRARRCSSALVQRRQLDPETHDAHHRRQGQRSDDDQIGKLAGGLQKQANGTWDKLETVFEERVERALTRLGVPTNKEITRADAPRRAADRQRAASCPARRPVAKKAAPRKRVAKKACDGTPPPASRGLTRPRLHACRAG
ncbi:MAG: phasin family protein [Comamonadaceae bacterium]|nr:phasin family protein [Comamonadaceae bacterium]